MFDNLAMLDQGESVLSSQHLADRLSIPCFKNIDQAKQSGIVFFLCYRNGCLTLLDQQLLKKGGMRVEVDPRQGEQHSWPAPKNNQFALALGKKTVSVVDATTGWAQDSLAMFRMGFQVTCIERSPIMAVLVEDGLKRLAEKDWVKNRQLRLPKLIQANAIETLATLDETPDCIYLDPMFPPKRKKSALAKKNIAVLRDILGDDVDKQQLFAAAWQAAACRVVVKSPDYAEPLGGKPNMVYQGKLLRYDVYLKK